MTSAHRIKLVCSLLLFVLHIIFCVTGHGSKAKAESQLQHITPEQKATLEKAYTWGWPMVYLYNMRKSLEMIKKPGLSGGAPVAPVNRLCMRTTPLTAEFKKIPCANPEFVYGFAMLDLSRQPVIVQVPSIDNRFWLIQLGDHRTESFGSLGVQHQTKPGFYAIVGPDWQGDLPTNVNGVFQSPTNLAYVIPRIHIEGPDESLDETLNGLNVYPLSHFDGEVQPMNWKRTKWYPQIGSSSRTSSRFVHPRSFFNDLQEVMEILDPTESEREIYADLRAILKLAHENQELAAAISDLSMELEKTLIEPLFEFNNFGVDVPNNWTTINNGACFGNDIQTRTAVAKSNIFVNKPTEAKYFYSQSDSEGAVLHGSKSYLISLSPNDHPKHDAFWSITVYDADHNLVGASNNTLATISSTSLLKAGSDRRIQIALQTTKPIDVDVNWLPIPEGDFVVYLRVYSPALEVIENRWAPPAIRPSLNSSNKEVLISTGERSYSFE